MNPEYTLPTDDLGEFVLAVYICPECEREFYDDDETGEPSFCPYCGEEFEDDEGGVQRKASVSPTPSDDPGDSDDDE